MENYNFQKKSLKTQGKLNFSLEFIEKPMENISFQLKSLENQ